MVQQTSTEQIRAALDDLLSITVRERELLDKESDAGITAEESAEIDELRKARGKGPVPRIRAASRPTPAAPRWCRCRASWRS